MNKEINIVVIGASGYTGLELIRILYKHPHANIKALVADSNAGKEISEIYQHLGSIDLPILKKVSEVNFNDIDVVFCCMPHATSQKVISDLPKHVKIIDLSADFRIKNANTYKEWYGVEHIAEDLQKEAVYGLTELNKEEIITANIVACPGCYPTSILLPLLPLLNNKIISTKNIIADSKTGISGAGRSVKLGNLFSEIDGGIKAYSVGGHRHVAEIEQELSIITDENVQVTFTPQIAPMTRGILSSIYVDLEDGMTIEDMKNSLEGSYKDSQFVKIFSDGYCPSTKDVYSTNKCVISIFKDRIENRAIIISAIDNLIKGSSGQAVQNMNCIFGIDENLGLDDIALYP